MRENWEPECDNVGCMKTENLNATTQDAGKLGNRMRQRRMHENREAECDNAGCMKTGNRNVAMHEKAWVHNKKIGGFVTWKNY